MKRPTTATSDPGLREGYRSGLEDKVAAQLKAKGIMVRYEAEKFRFVQPAKPRTYKPDFILPNGIVIETKGRFVTADRQKHKWLKDQHPGLDVRFVFSRSASRLSKGSPTTYADWCVQYGFKWADGLIPAQWIAEPPCPMRFTAIEEATKK